jgi:hypothetical protein
MGLVAVYPVNRSGWPHATAQTNGIGHDTRRILLTFIPRKGAALQGLHLNRTTTLGPLFRTSAEVAPLYESNENLLMNDG